jgi:hypothetical protein
VQAVTLCQAGAQAAELPGEDPGTRPVSRVSGTVERAADRLCRPSAATAYADHDPGPELHTGTQAILPPDRQYVERIRHAGQHAP